jgi:ParB-like nuclease domain
VSRLQKNFGLRFGECDLSHARRLAESYELLPPIIVHGPSMAIIDGVHRVLAAQLLNRTEITARVFPGAEDEALLLAIRANVGQGKPLVRAEREEAARRVLAAHPDWSNRRVAAVCDLSASVVAQVRRCSTAGDHRLNGRVGRDERVRPVDAAGVRSSIARLLGEHPNASLRWVAGQVGCSPATVLDVRRRLARNEHPVPSRLRGAETKDSGHWATDSACSSTSDGRDFADWFERSRVSHTDMADYVSAVPLSRVYLVAAEARARATAWSTFASLLEQRGSGRRAGRGHFSGEAAGTVVVERVG